jgi:hypothetical protein
MSVERAHLSLDDFIIECEETATFRNEYKQHFMDLSPTEMTILQRMNKQENFKSLQQFNKYK